MPWGWNQSEKDGINLDLDNRLYLHTALSGLHMAIGMRGVAHCSLYVITRRQATSNIAAPLTSTLVVVLYRPTPTELYIGHCYSLTRDAGRSPPADNYVCLYPHTPDACLSHPEPGALLKAAAAFGAAFSSGMRDAYSER